MAVVRAGMIVFVMLAAWWAVRDMDAHQHDPHGRSRMEAAVARIF